MKNYAVSKTLTDTLVSEFVYVVQLRFMQKELWDLYLF